MTAFSIFLPIHDEASWLPGAIESVLAQTHGDFELVIGDNASDDDVAAVVHRYCDPRIRYHRFDDLVPVNESFNRTAALCRNAWVHPLSADDRLRPDALEALARAIEAHDDGRVVLVAGDAHRVDPDGRPNPIGTPVTNARRPVRYRRIATGRYDAAGWVLANAAPGVLSWMPGTLSFRRHVLVEGGMFRTEMGLCADLELVVRVAAYGDVVYLAQPLLDYTVRTGSATHHVVQRDLERRTSMTMLGKAWLSAIALHEDRRVVTAEERAAMRGAIARSLLQRAVWHRRSPAGRGRGAAIRDVCRALRWSPGTVLTPSRAVVLVGAVLAPRWLIERLSVVGHRYGVVLA